eukprot:1186190-Prorocentrum_minimum.AAC.1
MTPDLTSDETKSCPSAALHGGGCGVGMQQPFDCMKKWNMGLGCKGCWSTCLNRARCPAMTECWIYKRRGCAVIGSQRRGCAVIGSQRRGCAVIGSRRRGCAVIGPQRRGCAVIGSQRRGCAEIGSQENHGEITLPALLRAEKALEALRQ